MGRFTEYLADARVLKTVAAILILLSLGIKVYKAVAMPPPSAKSPSSIYYILTEKALDGKIPLDGSVDPGPCLFMGAIYTVFGVSVVASRMGLIAFSFALSYYLFRLTRHFAGLTVARVAFVLSLFDPILIYYCAYESCELIVFLLIAAFFHHALMSTHPRGRWHAAIAGLLIGLGTLFKPWFWGALPIFALMHRGDARKKSIKATPGFLAALTVCLMTVAPWQIYYTKAGFGDVYFISILNQKTLFILNNPYNTYNSRMSDFPKPTKSEQWGESDMIGLVKIKDEIRAVGPFYDAAARQAVDYMFEHPEYVMERVVLSFFKTWIIPVEEGYYSEWRFAPLALTWIWTMWGVSIFGAAILYRSGRRLWPFFSFMAIATLWHLVAALHHLYKDVFIPFETVFAAVGLTVLLRAFQLGLARTALDPVTGEALWPLRLKP